MKLFKKREKDAVEISQDQLLRWKLELETIESKVETAKKYLEDEKDHGVGLLMLYSIIEDAKGIRYQIECYMD